MDQKPSLEILLKQKKISQKTYDRVKVAKEYIENKYNLKSVLTTKWSNILPKIQNLNINLLKMFIIKDLSFINYYINKKCKLRENFVEQK